MAVWLRTGGKKSLLFEINGSRRHISVSQAHSASKLHRSKSDRCLSSLQMAVFFLKYFYLSCQVPEKFLASKCVVASDLIQYFHQNSHWHRKLVQISWKCFFLRNSDWSPYGTIPFMQYIWELVPFSIFWMALVHAKLHSKCKQSHKENWPHVKNRQNWVGTREKDEKGHWNSFFPRLRSRCLQQNILQPEEKILVRWSSSFMKVIHNKQFRTFKMKRNPVNTANGKKRCFYLDRNHNAP